MVPVCLDLTLTRLLVFFFFLQSPIVGSPLPSVSEETIASSGQLPPLPLGKARRDSKPPVVERKASIRRVSNASMSGGEFGGEGDNEREPVNGILRALVEGNHVRPWSCLCVFTCLADMSH